MSEQTIGAYWIVDGMGIMELWASAQLGDYQHRRNYKVWLRKHASGTPGSVEGERFSVNLQIDEVGRTSNPLNLDIEGVALLTGGAVKVRGRIFVGQHVRGDLHTVAYKRCDKCLTEQHTDRKRCDECGEVLRVMETYLLEPRKRLLDISEAVAILSESKVVTAQQACEAFDRAYLAKASHAFSHSIPYSRDIILECGVLNRAGKADWRLVYALPFSLRQQREIVGVDRNNQHYIYGNDWWLNDKEDAWATSQPEAGYYLIDFKGRFNRTNWNDQNVRISEMGDAYERADERVFAQSLISIFKTHDERLHEGTYHWGRMEASDGSRVFVGDFDSGGLLVGHARPSDDDDRLFVGVARKFQS
ncbi:MAG: hypothetical protein KW802_00490 [Candidatus Doudnabacteria bacterium]|nr:hypothetical protein [Candidatus Doudnabacteria bacterium]